MKNKGNRTHSRAKDHRTCLPCPLMDQYHVNGMSARLFARLLSFLSAVQNPQCNTEGSRQLIAFLFHLNSCSSG